MTETTNGESPMQKECVCLQLHVRRPGVRAKVDKSKLDLLGAEESMISVSKKIVDSPEYRRVNHTVNEMRSYLKTVSLPSPTLHGGFWNIPLPLVEDVISHMAGLKMKFLTFVDEFIAAYSDRLVTEAKERLGELFDEDDYPTAGALRSAFGVDVLFISLDVPGNLRTVSQAIFEKEKQRSEARWRDLEQETIGVMRAEMKGFIDTMVHQLGRKEDGKKRAFMQGSVDKLASYLENFELRNINNDDELSKLAGVASKMLDGIDVKGVRKQDEYRDELGKSFGMVKEQLDALVIEMPTRAITFDSEEV